jgi:hypothetical protein
VNTSKAEGRCSRSEARWIGMVRGAMERGGRTEI